MPDKENVMQDAVLYFTNANGEKMFLNAANFSINKAAEAFNKVGDKIYEASESFRDLNSLRLASFRWVGERPSS